MNIADYGIEIQWEVNENICSEEKAKKFDEELTELIKEKFKKRPKGINATISDK